MSSSQQVFVTLFGAAAAVLGIGTTVALAGDVGTGTAVAIKAAVAAGIAAYWAMRE